MFGLSPSSPNLKSSPSEQPKQLWRALSADPSIPKAELLWEDDDAFYYLQRMPKDVLPHHALSADIFINGSASSNAPTANHAFIATCDPSKLGNFDSLPAQASDEALFEQFLHPVDEDPLAQLAEHALKLNPFKSTMLPSMILNSQEMDDILHSLPINPFDHQHFQSFEDLFNTPFDEMEIDPAPHGDSDTERAESQPLPSNQPTESPAVPVHKPKARNRKKTGTQAGTSNRKVSGKSIPAENRKKMIELLTKQPKLPIPDVSEQSHVPPSTVLVYKQRLQGVATPESLSDVIPRRAMDPVVKQRLLDLIRNNPEITSAEVLSEIDVHPRSIWYYKSQHKKTLNQ